MTKVHQLPNGADSALSVPALSLAPLKDLGGAQAAMLFLDGQYLLQWREDGREVTKFLSPSDVRQAFVGEPVDSGWIGTQVCRWGTCQRGEYLASFHPPSVFPLLITEGKSAVARRLKVPLPGLFFLGIEKDYYVWAMAGDRFDPAAPLAAAPLPNVNESGQICFGVNQPPRAVGKGIERAWTLFMTSTFTDHSVKGKSRKHRDDVRLTLQELAQARARKYPAKDLVKLELTAETVMTHVYQRSRAN